MAAQRLLKAVAARGFDSDRATSAALRKACSSAEARGIVEWLAELLQKNAAGGLHWLTCGTAVKTVEAGVQAAKYEINWLSS